jgi:hypothetical protein
VVTQKRPFLAKIGQSGAFSTIRKRKRRKEDFVKAGVGQKDSIDHKNVKRLLEEPVA